MYYYVYNICFQVFNYLERLENPMNPHHWMKFHFLFPTDLAKLESGVQGLHLGYRLGQGLSFCLLLLPQYF